MNKQQEMDLRRAIRIVMQGLDTTKLYSVYCSEICCQPKKEALKLVCAFLNDEHKSDAKRPRRASGLSNVPRWVFGPAVHPAFQFVRDFVLHRLGYHRNLWSCAVNAYVNALWRQKQRGKMTSVELTRRIRQLEKWL